MKKLIFAFLTGVFLFCVAPLAAQWGDKSTIVGTRDPMPVGRVWPSRRHEVVPGAVRYGQLPPLAVRPGLPRQEVVMEWPATEYLQLPRQEVVSPQEVAADAQRRSEMRQARMRELRGRLAHLREALAEQERVAKQPSDIGSRSSSEESVGYIASPVVDGRVNGWLDDLELPDYNGNGPSATIDMLPAVGASPRELIKQDVDKDTTTFWLDIPWTQKVDQPASVVPVG